ncbi:MAG TPA: SDR family oxidoreductase [Solirubrobacterales bacterium]|nr:SDR family oxidoreductase [Solirubrobacterales bacterium]
MDLGLAGRTGAVVGGGALAAAVADRLHDEGADVLELGPGSGAGDMEHLGSVDVLVNVPPAAPGGEEWAARFELDVMDPLRTMRAAAPAMAARGWGRIVNVAPASGRRPTAAEPAGSVTGAAELALSRLFADRYARSGVLVNAVCAEPGADPAATAATVVLLCSERASYVDGAAWS